jgi:hypothetical protein
MTEYLVTGQGYKKTDRYKQTILLHDSFFCNDSDDASAEFNEKFSKEYNLLKIHSVIPLDKEEKFV